MCFCVGLRRLYRGLLARLFIKESEVWEKRVRNSQPRIAELFSPAVRKNTLSGLAAAVTALITWWACNAFVPLLGGTLASEHAAQNGITGEAARVLSEAWKSQASNRFNLGGLLGALASIPPLVCDGPAADVHHVLRLFRGDAVHHTRRAAVVPKRACGCCSP